jgi:hypothetical protein
VGELELKQKDIPDDVSMTSASADAEIAKAEEYKSKGNEFFKSKCIPFKHVKTTSSMTQSSNTLKRSTARFQMTKRLFITATGRSPT